MQSQSQLGSSRAQNLPTQIFKITSTELKDFFNQEVSESERMNNINQRHNGLQGILFKLQTRQESGIMGDVADIRRRQHKYSKNEKPRRQRPPFTDSMKDALKDRILLLVALFAVLSIIPGMIVEPKSGWIEGVFILVALFVQVLVTALNDHSKDSKFVELQSKNRDETLPVLRGKTGSLQTESVWNLVVGDIIQLKPGDKIPADCLVLKSNNLHVKEITRQDQQDGPTQINWRTVIRNEEQPFLYADSFVLAGTARAVVCAVGEFSTRGINDTEYDTRDKATDLSKKLAVIGKSLKFIAIISALVILAASLIVLFMQVGINDDVGGKIFTKKLVDCFTIAVIILVVAIPEGLPTTVTVSLAHSVLLMSEYDKVLVRDLDSVQTAGLLDYVCLGKTGTMTTEEMSVVKFFTEDSLILNSRKNTLLSCDMDPEIIEKIVESICINTNSYIEMTENSFYSPTGNGTDVSLLKWLQAAEIPVHEYMATRQGRVLAYIPFNSTLKRSIIAVQHPQLENTVRIYVKGAPEIVVNNAQSHYSFTEDVNEQGLTFKRANKIPFDEQAKARVINDIMTEQMTQNSLRAIALSYCDMSSDDFSRLQSKLVGEIDSAEEIAEFEQNQTFLALIALQDPVRENMKELVKEAADSDIQLQVISGDNLMTAAAVACDVGIISKQEFEAIKAGDRSVAMDATDFRQIVGQVIRQKDDVEEGADQTTSYSLSPDNQARFNSECFNKLKVIGRAEPEDKLSLVTALRACREEKTQVAIVGEGINDIEAFESADVSFAVADGTSIARNSASMVLEDNDFNSCIQAVKWGRNIYMNVRRFIQFQVTCNLTAIIVVFVSYITMTESILNATQLIYINLIMDVLGAIGLASTRPSKGKTTYNAGDNVMTGVMYRQILGGALYMTFIMMVVMFAGQSIFKYPYFSSTQTIDDDIWGQNKMRHFTICFNCFIFLQFFNMILCRDVSATGNHYFSGLHRNFMTWLILICIFTVQFFACFTWLGRPIFETRVIQPRDFAVSVACASSLIVASILLKMIPESLVSKIPSLDEDKSLGSENAIMRVYDEQATGEFPMNAGAAIQEEDKESYAGSGGHDSDDYRQA